MHVYNAGTVPVFIEFGDTNTTVASKLTSMPIPPGASIILTCPNLYVAVVTDTDTSAVYLTPGNGGI